MSGTNGALEAARVKADNLMKGIIEGLEKRTRRYRLNEGTYTPEFYSQLKSRELFPAEYEFLSVEAMDKAAKLYVAELKVRCLYGEQHEKHKKIRRLDADILRKLGKRIFEVALSVAKAKIEEYPSLLEANNEDIIAKLRNPGREGVVLNRAEAQAREYGLPEPARMRSFFRSVIEYTIRAEEDYVVYRRNTHRPVLPPVGFGQEVRANKTSAHGW